MLCIFLAYSTVPSLYHSIPSHCTLSRVSLYYILFLINNCKGKTLKFQRNSQRTPHNVNDILRSTISLKPFWYFKLSIEFSPYHSFPQPDKNADNVNALSKLETLLFQRKCLIFFKTLT